MIAGNNKLVFLLAFRVLANDQNGAEKVISKNLKK